MKKLLEELVSMESRELDKYMDEKISEGGWEMWFWFLTEINKISNIQKPTRKNFVTLTRFSLFNYICELKDDAK